MGACKLLGVNRMLAREWRIASCQRIALGRCPIPLRYRSGEKHASAALDGCDVGDKERPVVYGRSRIRWSDYPEGVADKSPDGRVWESKHRF